MAFRQKVRLWLGITTFLLWTATVSPPLHAAEKFDDLRSQARQLEKEGDWAKACSFYAAILRKDPSLVDVQERFQDRKSTRLNSSHIQKSRMPSSA